MKRYAISSCIYLFFLCASIVLIYTRCHQIQQDHLQLHLTTEEAAINSSSHTYSLLAQAINDEVIQTEEVLQRVHAIVHSEGRERNILRGKLFRLLDPVYQRLRGKQVRQLHFHFPDNRSLLRFHTPSRSDDSLVGIRPSVVRVNKTHEAVHGFESGRIFHGFRHVYPLRYHGEHIGSIEISTSFYQLREEFKHLSESSQSLLKEGKQAQLAFLLYRPEMWHKVFDDLHTIYQPSLLDKDYVIERADLIRSICDEKLAVSPLIESIQKKLAATENFKEKLAKRQSFATATNFQGQTYTVVFHSIKNTLGQHAAYIMSVTPEPFLVEIRDDGVLMGFFATILLTALLLYRFRFLAADEREKRQTVFLSNISDNLGTALYTTNRDGIITFANTAMEHLLGYSQQEMLGSNAHSLFHEPLEKDSMCICEEVLMKNTTIRSDHYAFQDRLGTPFPVEVICSPLREHKQIVGTATIFQDISQRRAQEKQLKKAQEELLQANEALESLARFDGLTSVHNRRSFDEQINRLWRSAQRLKQPLGLLMIDIDHFKRYNDCFGHLQGDQCLQTVANVLETSCKRPEDFVARYGGEEFAILLPYTSSTDCYHVARRIQKNMAKLALDHPMALETGIVTLSIGCCSMIPQPDKKVQDLIFEADQFLYSAKENGRNRVCGCSQ